MKLHLPQKMVSRLQENANHVQSLRMMIGLLSLLLGMALIALYRAPDKITFYVPPDLTNGAVMGVGDVPKATVLTNTAYLWIELNTWMNGGQKDAFENLENYQFYFGERFIRELTAQYNELNGKGELNRKRRLTLIPGTLSEFDKRVIVQSKNNSWVVLLDVIVEDFFLNERVQYAQVRYPLIVERIETNYDQNPIGMIITGLAGQAKIIKEL
ncbi:DUF2895 family protein [Vibrio sp.]|uniref:DUF2895 family protein n=1 Tax=Vibrio sp. TaxID=678 RepID=UPI003D09B0D4